MEEILRVDLGELKVDVKEFDLVKQEIDINNVSLSNSFISFQHTGIPIDSTIANKSENEQGETPWLLSLSSIELKNNSIQYYDFNSPTYRDGLNFDNLWIRDINLQAKDLSYAGNKAHGEIELLSLPG